MHQRLARHTCRCRHHQTHVNIAFTVRAFPDSRHTFNAVVGLTVIAHPTSRVGNHVPTVRLARARKRWKPAHVSTCSLPPLQASVCNMTTRLDMVAGGIVHRTGLEVDTPSSASHSPLHVTIVCLGHRLVLMAMARCGYSPQCSRR